MKKRNFTQLFLIAAFSLGMHSVTQAQSPNPPETLLDPPIHNAEDVLAIYSDAYAVDPNMPILNGTEAAEQTILDNKMWHVKIGEGSDPCYLEFATPLDLSDYNTFFIDVYAVEANAFDFQIRLNGADKTQQLKLQVKTGWNRLEFDLNDFKLLSTVPDLANVSKINFVGGAARTIYIDNIYMCKVPHSTMTVIPTTPAPTPTQKASDVLPVFTDVYPDEIGATLDAATVGTPAAIKGLTYDGKVDKMIFVNKGKTGNGGLNFNKTVDITTYDSIHFDIYPIGNTIPMRVKIAGISNQGTMVTAGTKDTWNSMDIALADWQAKLKPTDNPDLATVQTGGFWLFQATGYERTFFLDNVFFYKTRTEGGGPGTGINTPSSQELVSVSTQGNTIILSSEVAMNAVQVYALSGQHIRTLQDVGNKATINLQSEQSGIYLLKVSLANGETITKKILNM